MAEDAIRPLRARLALFGLVALLLAGLAWIGWQIGRPSEVTARPALWHMSKGKAQAWLFGTVHAVPADRPWLSPRIAAAAAQSDRLVLEVTGLDAERRSRTVFEKLGRSPGLPPIQARLAPADITPYQAFAARHAAALHGIDGYESWAAALLLHAAASSGLSLTSEQAGEAVLARRFAKDGKPVQGLETIEGQLGLFDRLPEADQRLLLGQAAREAEEAPRLYADLYRAWAAGDLARLERQFLAPLATAPGLRKVLLDGRNARWSRAIDADLGRGGDTVFIAVGAGHLLGPASLQAHLARLGWRIERVQ